MNEILVEREPTHYTAAEIGALAHLYRGEVYRSTIWRTRLDNTTNWSVVSLGAAMSISFSSAQASELPLLIVGVLVWLFMSLEARRYRYFNVWRARARWMERHFYAPMLRRDGYDFGAWQETLADDYLRPDYHVGYLTAMGRRIRRNYLWILLIQTAAYIGKLLIHPQPVRDLVEFTSRADIGPIPGEVILALGVLYISFFLTLSCFITRRDAVNVRRRGGGVGMG
ncbi:DUF2270 domain-containing protein [Ruegeria hyattellae]|uniref:DUF2270 domain-containing protein n=1 Tax=Ruegeria hyattellae TaxID=3233337 RepID=UPI00355B932F